MKTLDRYIASIFLSNLAMSIVSLAALFLFQSMFGDLYEHSHTFEQIIIYHAMNLPQIFVQMCPPAVLLATVLTLSSLTRTNELVASYAIGVGLRRLMTIFLAIVLMVSCLILIMEDRILPPVFRARTNYYWKEMEKRTDFFLDIKRDKIWYRAKNMIYNLQRFDSHSKTIHGMSIYTFDEGFNLMEVIGAEKAEFSPNGWKLIHGTITVFSHDNLFPQTKEFAEKEVRITETPKDFQEIEKEVDGLKFKELRTYIERTKNAGADTKSYEVKFHSRISLSFISVVMCFLAVPFSVGTRREGGIAKDLTLCLVVTFFYWIFYSVGLSLGTNGALPPWLAAWLPSTVFVALAATLIVRKY
jgi:lipopolysaccharide export system permease protein